MLIVSLIVSSRIFIWLILGCLCCEVFISGDEGFLFRLCIAVFVRFGGCGRVGVLWAGLLGF